MTHSHSKNKKSKHSSDKKSQVKKPVNIYTNQSFPALGVPVTTLLQNDNYNITINNVVVERTGQVLIEANFSWFIVGQTSILIDVQRDSVSITNGPQQLYFKPLIFVGPAFPYVIDNTIEVVDTTAPKGTHTYTIVLTSSVAQTYSQILSYSTNVKTFDKETNQVFVNQQFPAFGTSDAIILSPQVAQDVVLPIKKYGGAVKLNVAFNFDTFINPILIDINILREDGTSVTNNFQSVLNTGGPSTTLQLEDNLNLSIIDEIGSDSYTLQILNKSSDVVNVDFYCFSAEVSKIKNTFTVMQNIPAVGSPDALTVRPYSSINIPIEVNVNKETKAIDFVLSANLSGSIGTGIQYLYNIKRDDISITNGSQLNFAVTGTPLFSDTVEVNTTAIAVDQNPTPGKCKYSVDIINLTNVSLGVDYISFIAEQGR
jgi:hypothetical protein